MSIVRAFLMSMGMFSVFPVPKNSWNEKDMHLIIPNMPFVGAIIGLVWFTVAVALTHTTLHIQLQSALITLIPFILNGFLHIDGYMDTADAIFSRRDLEEKRRIIKDSNVGAFAVIGFIGLMLLQFCAVYAIIDNTKKMYSLIFIPVMSRGVSGLSLLNLKSMSNKGFGASFKANTKPRHTTVIIAAMVIGLSAAYWINGMETVIQLIAAVVFGAYATFYVYRQMQGISGDLCGFIITVSEVAGLLCMASV